MYDGIATNIEEKYSDVDVLAVFEPDGINQYVYVGVAQDTLVVGTFYYEGFMDLCYCVDRTDTISQERLKSEYPSVDEVCFLDETDTYLLTGRFFNNPDKIPEGLSYTEFELDGGTYCFCLTGVADMYWIEKDGVTVESMYIQTSRDSVSVGYTYLYKDGEDRTFRYEVDSIPVQVLADPAQPLTPMLHSNVTQEYLITGCFYRDVSEIPETVYEYYEFTVDGSTYYYAVLSVD